MVRNAPRRPSRTTTPRPRKIAGRDEGAEPTRSPASTDRAAEKSTAAGPGAADPAPPRPPTPPRRPVAKDPAPAQKPGPSGGGIGRTSTLLALLALLVLVLVAQC